MWQDKFDKEFKHSQFVNYSEIKSFITKLIAEERAKVLKEVLPEEKRQFVGYSFGYNDCRQDIINNAKKLNIDL